MRWRAQIGLAIAFALPACASFTAAADASWTRVSQQRTSYLSFYACPAHAGRAHCDAIADPTRGSGRRGAVPAGAITAGPELQASPALLGSGAEGGYSPQDLRSAYDLPSASAGSGQTVAVVDAFDDPDAEADLNHYRSYYKLPECTQAGGCFQKVNEAGGSTPPAAEAGWAEEISLDLDMVSAICPNCHILLVEASSEEAASLASSVAEAVKLGATEVSNSYGFEWASDAALAPAFEHPGIPITVASGDSGYRAEWPAANPGVIAVGGTSLRPATNARHWSETVWYGTEGHRVYGTGSGCSAEPKPPWQTDTGCSFRTNNDVAAVADQNTPVSVYDSYASKKPWRLLGGTSVSTPIIAAAMALADPYTRSFEGAHALYLQAALDGTGALDDLTSGKNGACGSYLCEARIGYDGPTGLGSLWGAPEVPPPTLSTAPAGALSTTAATLAAEVHPNGAAVECRFEYGSALPLESSAPCSPASVSGTSAADVSASLTGLKPRTTYRFRVSGRYRGGSAAGEELTFTTAASAFSVATGEPDAVTQHTAALTAQVDPGGEQVKSCTFEYGTTSAYGSLASCSQLPQAGSAPLTVSATVTGLKAGTSYHFRILAGTEDETSAGSDETLRTAPAVAPAVTTLPATQVAQASAQLNATVDPELAQVSSCTLQYGTSSRYGTNIPCGVLPGPVAASVSVSVPIRRLVPNVLYYFRISAASSAGTSWGEDMTFRTAPALVPGAQTEPASEVASASATLNAQVNPELAQITACTFQYGTSSGYGSSLACGSLPAPGAAPVAVAGALKRLKTNTVYHFRIIVSDAAGTARGSDETFRTQASSPSSLAPL